MIERKHAIVTSESIPKALTQPQAHPTMRAKRTIQKCLSAATFVSGTSAVVAFKRNPRNSIVNESEYERTVERFVGVINQNVT
jgi:hypothetical protein